MSSYLTLTLLLAFSLLALWSLAIVAYARALLSPPRMTDGKAAYRLGRVSPHDLGLSYTPLTFITRDNLTLAAWWIPAEGSTRTAILLHGYADAKVGALAWAPLFRNLGYNLLLPDLRAHGESAGLRTTAGVKEANDVETILHDLRTHHPTKSRQILLFGASLGAATAALVATRDSALSALVLDSPVASFDEGAVNHARLLSLPGPLIVRPALKVARYLAGAEFDRSALTATLPNLKAPALVILPQQDALVSPKDREALKKAFALHQNLHPESRLWQPDCPHLLAALHAPMEYADQLLFSQKTPAA